MYPTQLRHAPIEVRAEHPGCWVLTTRWRDAGTAVRLPRRIDEL